MGGLAGPGGYGAIWLHEIKHDGFRVIARKEGKRVRLYSRPGNDLTHRFPLIVHALGHLRPGPALSTLEKLGSSRCQGNQAF
jgi:ATP-dependent DNA ligase